MEIKKQQRARHYAVKELEEFEDKIVVDFHPQRWQRSSFHRSFVGRKPKSRYSPDHLQRSLVAEAFLS